MEWLVTRLKAVRKWLEIVFPCLSVVIRSKKPANRRNKQPNCLKIFHNFTVTVFASDGRLFLPHNAPVFRREEPFLHHRDEKGGQGPAVGHSRAGLGPNVDHNACEACDEVKFCAFIVVILFFALTSKLSPNDPRKCLRSISIHFRAEEQNQAFFFVNCRAPRFQPVMFTGALGRCRSRKLTGDIAALVFLTSSFPSGFRRDVGSNPRPPFRGSQ